MLGVGDLVKRRNNGDLALVIKTVRQNPYFQKVKVVRLSCGNTQWAEGYEYEVLNESR